MAELRKRLVKSTKKWRLWIFGAVVLLGSLLGYLQTLGVATGHSGDFICGGSTVCVGEFFITVPPSVTNYLGETVNITQLCFGKDLKVILTQPEKVNNLGLYKTDKRYREDNPARWKKFNFTGNCINVGNNSFMINATKDLYSTVKWAIAGTDIDPKWIGKNETIMTYDYNTKTECNGNVCTATLGGSYAYDVDGKWKLIDEAKSLKNSSVSCVVNSDGVNIANCVDWNTTSITINLSSKDVGILLPLKIYTPNTTKNNSELKGDFKKDYAIKSFYSTSFASKNDVKTQTIPFSLGDILEFGSNSTTITLNESILVEDTLISSVSGTDFGSYETMAWHDAAEGGIRKGVFKIGGLNTIPVGSTIDNAVFNVTIDDSSLDTGEAYNYDVHHIYDKTKYNISNAEWTEGDWSGGYSTSCLLTGGTISGSEMNWTRRPTTSTQMNLTYESRITATAGGVSWHVNSWNVTNMVAKEFSLGNNNISIYMNVSIASGSPYTADCAYVNTSESATASSRPQLVITYTAGDSTAPTFASPSINTTCAGKSVNISIVIQDETGLSGYIFSTNNTGTWINTTWSSLVNGTAASNITTLNSTSGTVVNYTWYANDTSNNWATLRNSTTTTDCTLPAYSLNSTNSTLAGTPVKHNLNWTDNVDLSGYIFQFCNGTWNGTACLAPTFLSIVLNGTTGQIWDSYTDAFQPTTNMGTLANMYVQDCSSSYKMRSYMLWNLSVVPTGKQIIDANLSIYMNTNPNDYAYTLSIYNTTNNWTETNITWNNQSSPDVLQDAKSGGMDAPVRITFNVTNAVISQYSQSNKNMSLVLKSPETDGNCGQKYTFFTKEDTDTLTWETLNITYLDSYSSSAWVNDSFVSMTGTTNWSNVTKTINSTVGAIIAWCIYANDTANNWNGTSCSSPFSYVTTEEAGVSTCDDFDSTGLLDCADNCTNSTITVAGDLHIYSTGSGTANLTDMTIQGDLYENYTDSCTVMWYGIRNITGG